MNEKQLSLVANEAENNLKDIDYNYNGFSIAGQWYTSIEEFDKYRWNKVRSILKSQNLCIHELIEEVGKLKAQIEDLKKPQPIADPANERFKRL